MSNLLIIFWKFNLMFFHQVRFAITPESFFKVDYRVCKKVYAIYFYLLFQQPLFLILERQRWLNLFLNLYINCRRNNFRTVVFWTWPSFDLLVIRLVIILKLFYIWIRFYFLRIIDFYYVILLNFVLFLQHIEWTKNFFCIN